MKRVEDYILNMIVERRREIAKIASEEIKDEIINYIIEESFYQSQKGTSIEKVKEDIKKRLEETYVD